MPTVGREGRERSRGGRYWVRTSDLFGVNEARYHCANRPQERRPHISSYAGVGFPVSGRCRKPTLGVSLALRVDLSVARSAAASGSGTSPYHAVPGADRLDVAQRGGQEHLVGTTASSSLTSASVIGPLEEELPGDARQRPGVNGGVTISEPKTRKTLLPVPSQRRPAVLNRTASRRSCSRGVGQRADILGVRRRLDPGQRAALVAGPGRGDDIGRLRGGSAASAATTRVGAPYGAPSPAARALPCR